MSVQNPESAPPSSGAAAAASLCLDCGLCCDGVIFNKVELQLEDDSQRLQALGMPVYKRSGGDRFAQPCAALDDCLCQIYAERPSRCREFECILFQAVKVGRIHVKTAKCEILKTRQCANKVRHLLIKLGDRDHHLTLAFRVRKVQKRIESGALDQRIADLFPLLSAAMDELNSHVRGSFYFDSKESSAVRRSQKNSFSK